MPSCVPALPCAVPVSAPQSEQNDAVIDLLSVWQLWFAQWGSAELFWRQGWISCDYRSCCLVPSRKCFAQYTQSSFSSHLGSGWLNPVVAQVQAGSSDLPGLWVLSCSRAMEQSESRPTSCLGSLPTSTGDGLPGKGSCEPHLNAAGRNYPKMGTNNCYFSAHPAAWGFPVELCPAETAGYVSHCPEFGTNFGGICGLTAFL